MSEAEIVSVVGADLQGELCGRQRVAPTGRDFLAQDIQTRFQIGEVKDAVAVRSSRFETATRQSQSK